MPETDTQRRELRVSITRLTLQLIISTMLVKTDLKNSYKYTIY